MSLPFTGGGKANHHGERAEEQVAHLAAEFIARESNNTSLITVTRAVLSSRGDRATLFVTVFPDTALPYALDFLNRNRDEFRTFLKQKSRLRAIPSVKFEHDAGEKNRQRMDELGNQI
ncbi:MAG: ribosome-binding factor A [Candidatus Pacebacteria bacterium]|nr:ribosome-binding factor A [Candidatus Paceibacterota bacterium]MBP9840418.1 ribosome-binding factor A [Candidatus Paceibacterota bacterium]